MDDRTIRRLFRDAEQRFGGIERLIGKLPARAAAEQAAFRVCLVRVKERVVQAGGAGGKYLLTVLAYGESTAQLKGNLALPEGLVEPTDDNVALGLNLAENGRPGHALDPAVDPALYAVGLHVGRTVEDKAAATPNGVRIVAFWLVPPNVFFPVGVYKDGGVAGAGSDPGPAANCSFTYTLKSWGGSTVLATGRTPKRPRYPSTEYAQPADGSLGQAYHDTAGLVQLADAYEEFPASDTCADGGGA